MSSFLANTLAYATMIIKNQWGASGTGFLVSYLISQEEGGKIFLVTNKHVLNREQRLRNLATHIILHYNRHDREGNIERADILWPIIQGGRPIWKEHPDPDIDVLVFDLTNFVANMRDLHAKWAVYDLLATPEILSDNDISIGEEVIIAGYPLGTSLLAIRHRRSNLPLFRSGIIASSIGEDLEDTIIENGTERIRILRGFLIDGGVIHGSSGSPVILKPNMARFQGGGIHLGSSLPPYILGIVAETRYSPISDTLSYADLGLAFDASTIRETIDLFFS